MEYLGKREKKPIDFTQQAHKYPFSAVGLVFSKKKINNMMVPCIGTGFLIGPNIVLTCAHNVYQSNIKKDHEEI